MPSQPKGNSHDQASQEDEHHKLNKTTKTAQHAAAAASTPRTKSAAVLAMLASKDGTPSQRSQPRPAGRTTVSGAFCPAPSRRSWAARLPARWLTASAATGLPDEGRLMNLVPSEGQQNIGDLVNSIPALTRGDLLARWAEALWHPAPQADQHQIAGLWPLPMPCRSNSTADFRSDPERSFCGWRGCRCQLT